MAASPLSWYTDAPFVTLSRPTGGISTSHGKRRRMRWRTRQLRSTIASSNDTTSRPGPSASSTEEPALLCSIQPRRNGTDTVSSWRSSNTRTISSSSRVVVLYDETGVSSVNVSLCLLVIRSPVIVLISCLRVKRYVRHPFLAIFLPCVISAPDTSLFPQSV